MDGAALIGARFLQFVGAAILCGSPLFYWYGCAPAQPAAPAARLMVCLAAIMALIGTAAWIGAATVSFSSGTDALPSTLWIVLTDTRFGRACLLRALLLLVILAITCAWGQARPRALWLLQAVLGAAVTISFAWTGHGAADSGSAGRVHLLADVAHALAAAAWIGALPALLLQLLLALRTGTHSAACAASHGLERFSSVGLALVGILVFSGVLNGWFLIGPRWRSAYTTAYGQTLLIKLALFAGMLALAAFNRWRAAPALAAELAARAAPRGSLQRLRASLIAELSLALLVLLAVSLLGTQAPPMSTD